MPMNDRPFINPGKFRNKNIHEWTACICCVAMLAGMLFSRALMSVSMIVLFINALYPGRLKVTWSRWKQDNFTKWGLLFLITYIISGVWSKDTGYWIASWVGKLPFAFLPFAFLSVPLQQFKFRLFITIGIAILLTGAISYSLAALIMDPSYYLAGYEYSHPLPTTVYGDHIRFSLSIVFSMLMCLFLIFEPQEQPLSRNTRILLYAFCILFFIYLHVLAAKTGIMALYLMLLLYVFLKITAKNKWLGIAAMIILPILGIIAFAVIPTFRTKIEYVRREIDQYKRDGRFDYNFSDNGRMITYEIALHIIGQKPLTGTGSGDLMKEMKDGYSLLYPEVPEKNRLVPHNQFLYSATATGIPFSLALISMVFSPLFMRRNKEKIYAVITALVMIAALMVEAMLEVQFGVFIYLFFTLLWNNRQKNEEQYI